MVLSPATLLLITLISTPQVFAWFRLPCNAPLIVERADPIVAPGGIAGHVHTVSGASAFSVNNTFANLRASTCSSCSVKEDMSVYWSPQLYFQHADGSFTSVDQPRGPIVNYFFRTNKADKSSLTAFPSGLRVLVGTPSTRSYNSTSLTAQAVGFSCIAADGTFVKTSGFPTTPCAGGLRTEIRFPSCWNGVDLDSTNHFSHMAFPLIDENGVCPTNFNTRVPTLMLETMWNTAAFDYSKAKNQSQPFVTSNGDPTGFSLHGDFMEAWKEGVLQKTITTSCPENNGPGDIAKCNLTLSNPQTDGICRKTSDINEVVLGNLATIPGCNLVSNTTASTVASCPSYVAPTLNTSPVVSTSANGPPQAKNAASPPPAKVAAAAAPPPKAGSPPPHPKRNIINF